MLRTAFDLGMTHFDLANNYGPPFGSAEENFEGHLKDDFKPYRDEMVISTLIGVSTSAQIRETSTPSPTSPSAPTNCNASTLPPATAAPTPGGVPPRQGATLAARKTTCLDTGVRSGNLPNPNFLDTDKFPDVVSPDLTPVLFLIRIALGEVVSVAIRGRQAMPGHRGRRRGRWRSRR